MLPSPSISRSSSSEQPNQTNKNKDAASALMLEKFCIGTINAIGSKWAKLLAVVLIGLGVAAACTGISAAAAPYLCMTGGALLYVSVALSIHHCCKPPAGAIEASGSQSDASQISRRPSVESDEILGYSVTHLQGIDRPDNDYDSDGDLQDSQGSRCSETSFANENEADSPIGYVSDSEIDSDDERYDLPNLARQTVAQAWKKTATSPENRKIALPPESELRHG